MTKHTKGPWRTDEQIWLDDDGIDCITIFGPEGPGHGRVGTAYAEIGREDELWPNAQLQAAAPELLEALEDARKAIAGLDKEVLGTGEAPDGSHFWYLQHELLNKIGAAIATAESK